MPIADAAHAIERRSPDYLPARRLANDFIADFRTGAVADYNIIEALCRLALDAAEPRQDRDITRAIFSGIIEPLCDDFSAGGVDVCNRVLAHILTIVRQSSQGGRLNRLLNHLGFYDSAAILCRYEKIIEPRPLPAARRIKKIIILSRVTAGADIAITSVMVHRLAKSLPWAELVLIGPGHLAAMFPELDLQAWPFVYKNDGQLIDKVTSWPPLYEMVRRGIKDDAVDSVLLFDPDTRMTQLGLLPLIADSSTRYFPSRVWQSRAGSHDNLSVLTNNWLNIILGETEEETPYLILHSEGHGYNAFCQQLRSRGVFVIAVNLGVGNDCRKKISRFFEERLLFKLAREPHTMLILDSGRGEEEMREMRYLFERARQQGIPTASLGEEQIPLARIKCNHGLVVFRGSLDALGKMISAADCFLGYDSCGQHLAAATGTPAVIIFAGAPSRRFIEHWSPAADKMKIITADSRQANTDEGCAQLIAKIKNFINLVKTSKRR